MQWNPPNAGPIRVMALLLTVALSLPLESCGDEPTEHVADETVDSLPPAPIRNLSISTRPDSSFELRWIATGDDGTTGRATAYDVRYCDGFFYDPNWFHCSQLPHAIIPAQSGDTDSMIVAGLERNKEHFFGLKVMDDDSNWSALSNVVSGVVYEGAMFIEDIPLAVGSRWTYLVRADYWDTSWVDTLTAVARDTSNFPDSDSGMGIHLELAPSYFAGQWLQVLRWGDALGYVFFSNEIPSFEFQIPLFVGSQWKLPHVGEMRDTYSVADTTNIEVLPGRPMKVYRVMHEKTATDPFQAEYWLAPGVGLVYLHTVRSTRHGTIEYEWRLIDYEIVE